MRWMFRMSSIVRSCDLLEQNNRVLHEVLDVMYIYVPWSNWFSVLSVFFYIRVHFSIQCTKLLLEEGYNRKYCFDRTTEELHKTRSTCGKLDSYNMNDTTKYKAEYYIKIFMNYLSNNAWSRYRVSLRRNLDPAKRSRSNSSALFLYIIHKTYWGGIPLVQ